MSDRDQREKQTKRSDRKRGEIEVIDLDSPKSRDRKQQKRNAESRKEGLKNENSQNRKAHQTSKKSGRNLEFKIVKYAFVAIFCGLIAYMLYFQVYKSDTVISSAYNKRQDLYAERIIRGDIVTSDGVTVATTNTTDDGYEYRYYPYDRMFAHTVGYVNNGKGGIENKYNFNLLRTHSNFLKQLGRDLLSRKSKGDTLVTTINYEMQERAYEALGDNRGAIVLMEVKTGKIIAMVSKPDFDPNTLADNWDVIVEDESSSVLINRASQGLYPPGSVFKILTNLEYIHENSDYQSYSYDCTSSVTKGGRTVSCYHGTSHGHESLVECFANSCNTAYATIGTDLNIMNYRSLCNKMLFNESLGADFPTSKSSFKLDNSADEAMIMQTAIGQGETLVSPLHMCMVAAAIDNKGKAMKPYMVDCIKTDSGLKVLKNFPSERSSIMSEKDAETMKLFMENVVEYGTAKALSDQSYYAAGKTGSAEFNANGDSHGWFVGYGSKEGYNDVAIAVIIENGGSGSSSAVPVAKSVFDRYFNIESTKNTVK